jgi:hypothetical protein
MSTFQESYVSRVLFARPDSGVALYARARSKMAIEAWARHRVHRLGALMDGEGKPLGAYVAMCHLLRGASRLRPATLGRL